MGISDVLVMCFYEYNERLLYYRNLSLRCLNLPLHEVGKLERVLCNDLIFVDTYYFTYNYMSILFIPSKL